MNESTIRGLDIFQGKVRCVTCHTNTQTHALFTDSRFHNLGIGFNRIENDVKELATAYSRANCTSSETILMS